LGEGRWKAGRQLIGAEREKLGRASLSLLHHLTLSHITKSRVYRNLTLHGLI
jgi:hypothetical protein